MNDSVGKVCGSCDKKGPDLLKCSVCKSAWYCDVQCQKKDWKRHKQCCRKFGTEAQKGHDTGEGKSSSSHTYQDRECASCGKTGIKLRKCGACNSERYCTTVCQLRDWGTHEKDCRAVKVYPEIHFSEETLDIDFVTGTFNTPKREDRENFIGKEMNMVVKIQTCLNIQTLTIDPNSKPYMRVYNESCHYDVKIEGYDKNYDIINKKVLEDGLPCVREHPLLRKLYCKAHLNPDFSLDVYLKCTYNIAHW